MWYGKSPFQIYNDVDRAFYESIIILVPLFRRAGNILSPHIVVYVARRLVRLEAVLGPSLGKAFPVIASPETFGPHDSRDWSN
jgi:hypothetical protein